MSDLHFEFHADRGDAFVRTVPVVGDVLVIAGDILLLRDRRHALQQLAWFSQRFPHVVYVIGNHELYGTSPAKAQETLDTCSRALPNLHVLDRSTWTHEGHRFVGATLWFPPEPEPRWRAAMNDFRRIDGFSDWVYAEHERHVAYLRETVSRGDIVVSHHLPHPECVAPKYRESPVNCYFLAKDAQDIAEDAGAALWIHGHTHEPRSITVRDTRIVCNPLGYPGEAKAKFDDAFIVEV